MRRRGREGWVEGRNEEGKEGRKGRERMKEGGKE
jgi:hypothetical protein